MIEKSDVYNTTTDLGSVYLAPEITSSLNIISFKSDIYSYGHVLQSILDMINPISSKKEFKEFITSLIDICTFENPNNRPTANDIIIKFFRFISNNNNDLLKNLFYSLAEKSYLLEIKSNSFKSYYYLGLIYEGKNNIDKAIECYMMLPDDKNASFQLGLIYFKRKDFDSAVKCFNKTIEKPHKIHKSFYYLGLIYEERNDIDKAIECYENFDDKDSLFNLALLYINKKNDIKKAVSCYVKLENKKDPIGYYNLGFFHENGIHYEKNIKKAMEYYSRAAAKNYSQAQFSLGLLHEKNNNFKEAYNYYKLAAAQNHPQAQYNLGL